MATLQKQLITTKSFQNAIVTPQGSKSFLKRLIPVVLSSIMYQRVNFDRKDFKFTKTRRTKYATFKPQLENPTLIEVKKWIDGILDAFKKDYLREIYVIFTNANNLDDVLESYKLQLKYFGDTLTTKEILKESTYSLFSAIAALNLNPLLDEASTDIQLAVTYYDEKTPKDYQPPHFEEDDKESILEILSSHSKNYLALGNLQTGFHTLKCRGKASVFSMDKSINSELDESTAVNNIIAVDEECDTSTVINFTNNELSNQEKQMKVNCMCGIEDEFENVDLIQCSTCLKMQHCFCEGFQDKASVDKTNYKCKQCSFPNIKLTEAKSLKSDAVYRLAVGYNMLNKTYPKDIIVKLNKNDETVLRRQLHRMDIDERKDDSSGNLQPCVKSLKRTTKMPDTIDLCSDDDLCYNDDYYNRTPLTKQFKKSF